MNTEIERKFLIVDQSWKATAHAIEYRQGYLCTEPAKIVRIRTIGDEGFLTIKGISTGAARAEFEYPLPYEDAQYLLNHLCLKPLIEKTRWHYDYKGHLWEIDEFSGENEGLIVAEIELTRESEPFDRPPWLGQEVSGDPRYYNASLVSNPYKKWSSYSDRTLFSKRFNSLKSMDSTGANTEPLPKPNPADYSNPTRLTPSEIESLRQDKKETSRLLDELLQISPRKPASKQNEAFFAKMKPDGYSGPRDLTPQEIESLRQDSVRAHRENMAAFAKMNPDGYSGTRHLTPSEIESLRQDKKDSLRLAHELRKANPRQASPERFAQASKPAQKK